MLLAVRAVLSLAAVLLVLWVAARAVRRGAVRGGGGNVVQVVARQQLGRGAAVAVVRVAGRPLLLGVTEQSVSVLQELEPDALPIAARETRVPVVPAEPAVQRRELLVPAAAPAFTTGGATDPVALLLASGTAAATDRAPLPAGALSGSALSPSTWKSAVEVLRERTVRRGTA